MVEFAFLVEFAFHLTYTLQVRYNERVFKGLGYGYRESVGKGLREKRGK